MAKALHPFRIDPSVTGIFPALGDEALIGEEKSDAPSIPPIKAVVVGGGTGAPVSIRTLLDIGAETSAIVAMADDGGSTGLLREEANVTPPGDVRKCLTAFARNPQDPLVRVFKYRFAVGKPALGRAGGCLRIVS